MPLLLDSLGFGLAIGFMLLGLIGVVVPIIPGTLLIWLSTLVYAVATQFDVITPGAFAGLTLLAFITGTADLWLPLLGARGTGAGRRGLLFGVVGSLVGLLVGSLPGSLIGYALGIIIGEYSRQNDWRLAVRASLGGLAGWGVATAVQLGGGLLMIIIFAVIVLTQSA